MSGEDGVIVGGARRAFAELTEATARLVADFAAAEDGAAELDPDLLLVGVDPLGGITLPVRAARTESERRGRRAPTPLERLAAAARLAAAGGPLGTQPREGGAVTAAGAAGRGADAAPPPPAGAAAVAPVFRLADRVTPSGTSPQGTAAEGVRTGPEAAESGASSGVAAALLAAAPVVGSAATGAAAGAAELIAQLTESILAASARIAATGGAAAASAGAAGRDVFVPGQSAGAELAFLAETLRSLGGETAAAFGLEPEAPHSRRGGESGELAEGAAPPAATGTPAAARPPGPELVAPAAPGPGLGVVPRPREAETDPAALAALVNDALVEQARRHGLELG